MCIHQKMYCWQCLRYLTLRCNMIRSTSALALTLVSTVVRDLLCQFVCRLLEAELLQQRKEKVARIVHFRISGLKGICLYLGGCFLVRS
jgi:hypothetical protein